MKCKVETPEQKWDRVNAEARAQQSGCYLTVAQQALLDAAACADTAEAAEQVTGDADWYDFANGVAARDTRSAHLYLS
jgi:hypothetical protein